MRDGRSGWEKFWGVPPDGLTWFQWAIVVFMAVMIVGSILRGAGLI